MFRISSLPRAFARIFEPPPPEPIWLWAETNVWLEKTSAAEPGFYRSSKTPWTRRLQEIGRNPYRYIFVANTPENAQLLCNATERLIPSKKWDGYWLRMRVAEFNVQKSSQSGFSEAILNVIRWRARWRPCNVIYSIDSDKEAKNISDRLLPTLRRLGAALFTGNDDDVGALLIKLRLMTVWLFGSFSSGKFANKQAPLVVADELEEHGKQKGDTSTDKNLESRKKTAAEGLQFNLSKPKLENGPINKAVKRGNQEYYFVPCPHCGAYQPLVPSNENDEDKIETVYEEEFEEIYDPVTGEFLDRGFHPLPAGQTRQLPLGHLVFAHCKDQLGNWDQLRLLEDTYYECGTCKGAILEHHKQGMNEAGYWVPTAIGEADIISQYFSDLYSKDAESSFGKIAKKLVNAIKSGRVALQGVLNHVFGQTFKNKANKTDESDIKANIAGKEGDIIPPYRKGVLSFEPWLLVLGSDIGGNYAKWSVIAIHENQEDAAVLDWGEELDPSDIADIINKVTWEGPKDATGKPSRWRIGNGFMDAKFRRTDAYRACLGVSGRRLIPYSGLGGGSARHVRLFTYPQIATYPKGFRRLDVNDMEAKNEMYIECLKKKVRRIFFPVDVVDPKHKDFRNELCAEELVVTEGEEPYWTTHGANHWGDTVKVALMGTRYMTKGNPEMPDDVTVEP